MNDLKPNNSEVRCPHLLNIDLYLFTQCINGFFNVSEVHGLNITDHWNNEPLQVEGKKLVNHM